MAGFRNVISTLQGDGQEAMWRDILAAHAYAVRVLHVKRVGIPIA